LDGHGVTTIDLPTVGGPVTVGSPELEALLDYIGDGVIERDERDEPPYEVIAAIKRLRLGALRLPVEQGGGGASLVQLYELFIDLAAADSNVAHIVRNHFGFVEGLLRRPHPHNERWLDRVRAGELFGGAATEINARAGATDLPYTTTIVETANGQRLNGTKYYSTGNLYVDWLVVGAQGVDGEKAQLIIPADRTGVLRPNDWDGIGQRFTGSGSTIFGDVTLYPDDYEPNEPLPEGASPWRATFFHIQLNAMIAGILRRVVRDAVELVRDKDRTFYHATAEARADDPLLQYTVGLLASQAAAAEALTLAAGAALQAATEATGTPEEYGLSLKATILTSKAKVVIDEIALRAASDLFEVSGGTAVLRSAHFDRHWRNIRTIAAHNPKTLKAVTVGAYEITGTPPPTGGFF
jgi:alkylation response protein AidB-like acyl-CoA dehydrogenase